MKLKLGKLLFPKLPHDLRRREMVSVYLILLVCAVVGLVMYVFMYKTSHGGGN